MGALWRSLSLSDCRLASLLNFFVLAEFRAQSSVDECLAYLFAVSVVSLCLLFYEKNRGGALVYVALLIRGRWFLSFAIGMVIGGGFSGCP
ncbi:unnamed protein product [Arabidopsis halleri]